MKKIILKSLTWVFIIQFMPALFVAVTFLFPSIFQATYTEAYEAGWIINLLVAIIMAFAYVFAYALKEEGITW